MLKFVEMVEYGNEPELMIDGLGSCMRLGNTLRFTYFARYNGDNRVVAHARWDRSVWLSAFAPYRQVREYIIGQLPSEFPSKFKMEPT